MSLSEKRQTVTLVHHSHETMVGKTEINSRSWLEMHRGISKYDVISFGYWMKFNIVYPLLRLTPTAWMTSQASVLLAAWVKDHTTVQHGAVVIEANGQFCCSCWSSYIHELVRILRDKFYYFTLGGSLIRVANDYRMVNCQHLGLFPLIIYHNGVLFS